jgi:hypothetical protein
MLFFFHRFTVHFDSLSFFHNQLMHFYIQLCISLLSYISFSKARHTLAEDGPIGPKHVAANKEIF